MSNAAELLTKSSYCRNSKHAKCKTEGCECKCHAIDASIAETEALQTAATAELADAVQTSSRAPKFVQPDPESTTTIDEILANIDAAEIEGVYFSDTELSVIAASDLPEADAAAKLIADRLDPAKAPAPAPKPAKKAKAPKEPKPVVKGTVDGKLSNAHKRAIRVQMVAYLAAMPVDLTGDLEGVTPEEAAGYVDTYWVKYIDPARDKARHAK